MKISRKRTVAAVVLVVAAGAWFFIASDKPLDPRFNGTYQLADGRLVVVTARDGKTLRYRMMSGQTAALRPTGDLVYEAGPGWSGSEPVEVTVTFDALDAGPPSGLSWQTAKTKQRGERLLLPEIFDSFQSGHLELRAKLVLPKDEGPFPAVVIVHGSGDESAVDTYYNPYLMAARGIAVLVYDKRGTGKSEGKFTQNFHLLSDDTVAAVEWLRTRPEVDPANIHLAGYSQGGWIAPLAATKTEVQSLLIGYGPMVPVTGEDRWGYIYELQQAGYGEDTVREIDAVNNIASRIIDHNEDRWNELGVALDNIEDAEWIEVVRGSDSLIGFLTSTWMPLWAVRIYAWWQLRGDPPFVDRLYDPVPTVASLDIPSLWIFGGEDSSMPTDWSIDELERLKAAGRPIEFEVFPDAEHGILIFEETTDYERAWLGYAPGYMPLQVSWLRRQAGL